MKWKKLEYIKFQRSDIMQSSDMKNMVVLKNLPSNMVEEAIIIFKETQKVRQKELIDKGQKVNSIEFQPKSKEYILKEAEMLVTDYIKKIENKKTENSRDIMFKYKKLKKYSLVSTILLAISLIVNFI
jgi:hypothetical protein